MLRATSIILAGAVCSSAFGARDASARKPRAMAKPAQAPIVWKLQYTEDFKGTNLNEKLWSRIDQGESDWNRNMSLRDDLVEVRDGQLHAYGLKNVDTSSDSRTFLTGDVSTKGRFAVKYGKIEVRCKLEAAKGARPTIWMMPENPSVG